MKKIFLCSALITALVSCASDTSIPEAEINKNANSSNSKEIATKGSGIYFTTLQNTNLLSGPGSNYNTVTSIEKGAKVQILGKIFGNWLTVEYKEKLGFVKNSDLEKIEQDKNEYFTTIKNTALLKGPGSNYEVAIDIEKGAILGLISKDFGDYYTVLYKNYNGFINRHDMEKIK